MPTIRFFRAEQFGFLYGFGTRELLLSLTVLAQKCKDQRKDIFICFIDYEKDFDKVRDTILLECLARKGNLNFSQQQLQLKLVKQMNC